MNPVTPENLLRHELIGLGVKVVKDSNPSNVSITGTIVDESRNTLTIGRGGEAKKVAKKDATFHIDLPSGKVEVEGAALVGRPEDRVKRRVKRRW